MLVYARRDHGKDTIQVDPPPTALSVIKSLNDAHEKACKEHEAR